MDTITLPKDYFDLVRKEVDSIKEMHLLFNKRLSALENIESARQERINLNKQIAHELTNSFFRPNAI